MKYIWLELPTLPHFVNSTLFLCSPLVLLAVLCTCTEFVMDTWCGGYNSESDDDISVWDTDSPAGNTVSVPISAAEAKDDVTENAGAGKLSVIK